MRKIKWTEEKIREEALKCKTRTEFRKGSGGAYNVANKLGILDEVCAHMPKPRRWTEETIKKEALKYISKSEFKRKNSSAYCATNKMGILDEVCAHMKPRFIWTEEKVKEEALKYNSKSKFLKNGGNAYNIAKKLNIFEEVCVHMKRPPSDKLKWTEETIRKEALKYNLKSEFIKKCGNVYSVACKLKILDKVCSHMEKPQPRTSHNFKWTEDIIKEEEALKCNSKSEFKRKSPCAYARARLTGILDRVCSHMKPKHHSKWTKKEIKEEAKKYSTRSEFAKNSSGAYDAMLRLNILDEVCSRIKHRGTLYKRMIYVIMFPRIESFYVGLTCNFKIRKNEHLNEIKRGNKHLKELFKKGEGCLWLCIDRLFDNEKAIELEGLYIKNLEEEGWSKLNIARAGSLGGHPFKWTKETVEKEALKYDTRSEFIKNGGGAYNVAKKLGIFDKICSHMELKVHNWTKETLIKEAQKYITKVEFRKKVVVLIARQEN